MTEITSFSAAHGCRMTEFIPFPKIPRLNRDVFVTEKIDGTNACIVIGPDDFASPTPLHFWDDEDDCRMGIWAQSRNRFISPRDDNHGFAKWVLENVGALKGLGVGHHYGEWWGKGIGRQYGQTQKHFSLFDTYRWGWGTACPECCRVVPLLAVMKSLTLVGGCCDRLKMEGSAAAPGFMNPEGVIAYHTASKHYYKATIEKDEEYKSKKEI